MPDGHQSYANIVAQNFEIGNKKCPAEFDRT